MDAVIAAYSRFVPEEALGLMGRESITDVDLGDHVEKTMTILFADIRDFSALSEEMTPRENFAFINDYLNRMEPAIARHGGIIDKYIGDGIMALFPENADDALRGAIEMLKILGAFNKERETAGMQPIRIGIGLNTGLMMLGIIGGRDRMESTVISDAVNLAARIEGMTKRYGAPLLISEHTYYGLRDAARHDTRFIDRVMVKGKRQPQSVYEVFDADPPEQRDAKRATKALFGEALAYYHFKEASRALELLSECLRMAPGDTVALAYRDRCKRFLETGYHEGTGEVDLRIAWDDSLSIGETEIDAQHQELFRRVAGFVEAVRRDRNYSKIHEVVEFLDHYIVHHFAAEERCMAAHKYPFLPLQVDQHRRFRKYFDNFKREIEKNLDSHPTFLLFRTQVLVIDWIMHHVSKIDRHFGRFLSHADITTGGNSNEPGSGFPA